MQNDSSSAGPRGVYQPYYVGSAHLDGGNAWRNSPSEKPLGQRSRSPSPGLASSPSLSTLFTSLKKHLLRRQIASHSLEFPPSFNRRTRPLTTSTESSPFELVRFSFLCIIWYTTSALSSNTGKTILVEFNYPVTLTIIQFAMVAGYCLILMAPAVRFSRMRPPTRSILMTTLPMGAFQVGGHMFSSVAISRIPVSTVHTIKALSPLFTVAAYALLFGVKYSLKTYISLLPLTIGVMVACTFDVSASSPTGLICAFGSALIFVSQNIFFKKVMPSGSQTTSQKLDKLNLLLYSSSMAFVLMVPIWSFTDLPRLLTAQYEQSYVGQPQGHTHPFSLTYHFIANGTVNFAQNIIAFVILSSTSSVTYSIASLIKRIWVICMAIVWFNQTIHPIQGFGIALTFLGLWMYNSSKGDVEKGEKTMRRVEAMRDMVLPTNRAEEKLLNGSAHSSPRMTAIEMNPHTVATGRARLQLPTYAAGTQFNAVGHSQPRNLRIEISSPDPLSVFAKRIAAASPTEPYPSPPLSIDSPTSQVDTFGYSTANPYLSDLISQSSRVEQVSAA